MASIESIPKTVLMTADTIGGVWTYCMDLIRSMEHTTTQFHLVTAGRPLNEDQQQEISNLSNVTLHETDHKLEWMPNPWHDVDFSGWQLVELERKIKADIVHLNSYSYAALPFRAPVIVVAHSDVFSWWFSVRKSIPTSEWREYFCRVKKGLQSADMVVAPSHTMLNMLSAIYGSPADSRVIYNGRINTLFRPGQKVPRIMSAGRFWDEGKNLSLLREAAHYIKGNIDVAGETNDVGDGAKLQDNISYLGRLNGKQIAEQLSTSLVYVAPAKYEPFGLSILEAALSGCALVLGNIASLREIWKDSAIYVDTDNAEKLASACNELLRNPAMALEYGQKALHRSKIFSSEKMAKYYGELYTELVHSHYNLSNHVKRVI